MIIRRRVIMRAPSGLEQLRAQQLAQELRAERQRRHVDVAELEHLLALEREARVIRDGQVMTLERTVEGLRAQLLIKRRDLAHFMRAHGLGDQVRDDP